MKITLLPSTYYADPTYHRVLSSLGREFVSAGHEVSIISKTTTANPELQLAPESGAPAVSPLSKKTLAGLSAPGAVLNFHFSGWLRPWHLPLLLAGPPAAAKLVVTFQDYRHPDLPPLTPETRGQMRALLRKAHRITAVSGFLARMLKNDFPSAAARLRVVPNGTDLPSGQAPARRGRGYILTVGREAPYKGLDLLLFAFADAVERGLKQDLVVCGAGGRGPLKLLARKLGIEDRVCFKGVLPPGELSALLRGCLFYATTPRWESFGMAALEALAAGKAVLASRTGGLAGICRGRAVLVAPGDTRAAALGLLRLAADGELRRSLGQKAAAAGLDYSWARIAAGYLGAYR